MDNERMMFSMNENVELVFSSGGADSHWFGYYNYCPVDKEGQRLLAHRFSCEKDRPFSKEDILEIGWFSLEDGTWHPISLTHACNWQQGAMTQWLTIDGEQRIIFNDAQDGKYVSKIFNTDGTLYKTLPRAIYGINERDGFSITMNFERAYWCRAYHYEFLQDETLNIPVSPVDGIYRLEFASEEYRKIVKMDDILKMDYREEFNGAKHWVEHIMMNPSGTRFAFYHRFDTGAGYKTRCLITDVDGRNLLTIPDWERNSWSHLGWKNDDEFVLFGINRKAMGSAVDTLTNNWFGTFLREIYQKCFARLVSPQIHNKFVAGSNYQRYSVKDGRTQKIGNYEKGLLVKDGHPSFSRDTRFMLTDTYEDESKYRHLLLYDTEKDVLHELGKFYSPINECGYRCDLHPRFACDDRLIVIDSAHSGRHQIVGLKIDLNCFRV